MAKRFRNRTAREIQVYLEAKGFYMVNRNGDDRIYAKDGYNFTVKTPDRKNETIPNGTMDYILRAIGKCGISKSKNDVLRWWKENGYGD